jgi:hypothetical protein
MAKNKGLAAAIAGVGILFAWSGLYNKSVLQTVQDIIKGNKPQPGQTEYVGAAGTGGTAGTASAAELFPGTPSNYGLGVTAPSVPETSWIKTFLSALGAPSTQANIESISAWINHEGPYGTQGKNNPLNTTITSVPGYEGTFAGTPVGDYGTVAQGIFAEVETLLQGDYGDIVQALRSGKGLCGETFQGLSTWSGGGYSQVC